MVVRLAVLVLTLAGCGGEQPRSTLRDIEVPPGATVGQLDRALARAGWMRGQHCSLFWGESPRLYWDVQPVVIRWGGEERLRGFVLCGQARDAALSDPRIEQRVDVVFLRGSLRLVSPIGTLAYDSHPMSDEGDGRTPVMLRFDPDSSDRSWPAYSVLPSLRDVQDDVVIARWDLDDARG